MYGVRGSNGVIVIKTSDQINEASRLALQASR